MVFYDCNKQNSLVQTLCYFSPTKDHVKFSNSSFCFKMPRLSRNDHHRALGQLEGGVPVGVVARRFGVSEHTIFQLLSRVSATGTVDDRPRSLQPRVTTCHQDRYITLNHLRNHFLSAATARNTPGRDNSHISADTVRRRLHAAGLRARRPYQGSRLTEQHRWLRLT